MKKGFVIREAGAYYRNDRLFGGLSLSLGFDGDDGRQFAEKCERLMLTFDMHDPALALAWLDRVGHQKPRLGRALANMIVATIHWLERRGHLQSDDYNGVIWFATHRQVLFVIRHDEMPLVSRQEFRSQHPAAVEFVGLDSKDFEKTLRIIFGTPPSN